MKLHTYINMYLYLLTHLRQYINMRKIVGMLRAQSMPFINPNIRNEMRVDA